MELRRKEIREGTPPEDATNTGSKHVFIGGALLMTAMAELGTLKQDVHERLTARYRGMDTTTTEFLVDDIRICTWRLFREKTHGGLEFKLHPELEDVAQALEHALVVAGGTRLSGVQPKGPRVRELDKHLEGTWRSKGDGKGK